MGGRPELAPPIQELISEVSLYPPHRLWLSLKWGDRREIRSGNIFITTKTGHDECTRTEAVSEYGHRERSGGHLASRPLRATFIFFFFITPGLEMSDTNVYEPQTRDLLGTPSQHREAVVLKSRIVPSGTALGLRILRVVRRGAQAMYDQFDKRGTTVIPLGGNVGDAQGGRRDSPRGKRGWRPGKTVCLNTTRQLSKSYTSNAVLQWRNKPMSALNGTCVSPPPLSLCPHPVPSPHLTPPQGLLLPPLHPVGEDK